MNKLKKLITVNNKVKLFTSQAIRGETINSAAWPISKKKIYKFLINLYLMHTYAIKSMDMQLKSTPTIRS
ncbi:hypothetical protein GCM10023313_03810 [Mucilaginibacter defluvii]|uniref:Uncharacterized protein n=1 Tax=Mucilaginibacter defluvii TaxID=1196019 RepID=A0ABP9FKG4_9SPHI